MNEPPEEKRVSIDRQSLLVAIRHIEMIVVSLDRIGSCASKVSLSEIDAMTGRFVREWDVFRRVAEVRKSLCSGFSEEFGDGCEDEWERYLSDVKFWSFSQQRPEK